MVFNFVLALLALAASPGAGVRGVVGLRHEPGVETRLPAALVGEFVPMSRICLVGGLGWDLLRPGLPDRASLEVGVPVRSRVSLAAGVKLRRWPAWRTGENLAYATARIEPLPSLELEAGFAHRVPVLDTTRWQSPFVWSGPLAEWNIVYGLGWRLLDRPGASLAVRTGNLELFDLRTPGLVGVRLDGASRLSREWTAAAALAGEMKGFSAALAETGAISLELGVRRGL